VLRQVIFTTSGMGEGLDYSGAAGASAIYESRAAIIYYAAGASRKMARSSSSIARPACARAMSSKGGVPAPPAADQDRLSQGETLVPR
jgi:hypothetical protein